MAIISKAALNDGISPLVFNAYRQAIAALVLAPFALLLERRTDNMWSFGLFCKIFLAALCGPTVSLDLYYLALQRSSATNATAILNTIPVVTFLLSVLLRIETVGWGTFHGILKIVGMCIAIGGAMLLSFLGPIGSSTETSFHHVGNNKNRFLGPVLMFLCSVAWSLWLIVQPHLLKQYPSKLRLSTLQCLLSSVQATVAAAALQRNFDSWKIGGDIQLASLAYCYIGWPYDYWRSLFCSMGKEQGARAIKLSTIAHENRNSVKRAKIMLKVTPPIQPHDHNAFITFRISLINAYYWHSGTHVNNIIGFHVKLFIIHFKYCY
ncbi:hypothetical protein F2P56_020311 [Juglans regia]|uniref:WAT1-related protein n=1 Tax=Juglans regia TaxID=51240 RepID=A0A833X5G2_JUGRE|nr:hypothetical protein F2P56_020311 [Juglans regia]